VDANAFLEPFSRLAGRKNHKPFFIYLHIREPHHPYKMPPPFFGRYQQKYKKYSEKFKIEADRIYKGQTRNPEDFRFLSNIYDENLSYADHIVGKIIKSLEEKKQFEDTIIIITADHGEALGEHGMVGHNMVLHREGIQIPLIIYFPCGKKTSVTQERPAITSDIVVTLCDLLDISYPYPHLTRGKNLFSLPDKRTRICRSLTMPSNYAGYMIESFPYRMIFFPHTGENEIRLYNIKHDPEERNPINRESIEDAFKSILFQFVKDSTKGIKSGNTPELSKKELENLRSLGYIK
jgi:arylsulfatase A-like enzyme